MAVCRCHQASTHPNKTANKKERGVNTSGQREKRLAFSYGRRQDTRHNTRTYTPVGSENLRGGREEEKERYIISYNTTHHGDDTENVEGARVERGETERNALRKQRHTQTHTETHTGTRAKTRTTNEKM